MKATKEQIRILSRLSQQAAFDSLRKTKTRWVSKGFAVQAVPSDTKTLRYCVITSKHASKLATERNTMRRRLRAIAYEVLTTVAKPETDYMIVARKDSLILSMDDMRRDLKWCLKKLDLTRHADENRPTAD